MYSRKENGYYYLGFRNWVYVGDNGNYHAVIGCIYIYVVVQGFCGDDGQENGSQHGLFMYGDIGSL